VPYAGRFGGVGDWRRSRRKLIRPASPSATNITGATGRDPAARFVIWVAYERKASSDQRDCADIADPVEAAEPIEPIEPMDPTLPMDATDPTEPIESTDRCEAMDSTESVDHNDQRFAMNAS
jgi:hypothetical protein